MTPTSTGRSARPLSPHMQVYRPQLTSVLSITHRATGVVLGVGALVLLYWLLALASGPQAYAQAREVLASVPGQIALFVFTLAFNYHLCNGIRHLFWDVGMGFEMSAVYASGKAVVAATVILTAVTWGVALSMGGAGQ